MNNQTTSRFAANTDELEKATASSAACSTAIKTLVTLLANFTFRNNGTLSFPIIAALFRDRVTLSGGERTMFKDTEETVNAVCSIIDKVSANITVTITGEATLSEDDRSAFLSALKDLILVGGDLKYPGSGNVQDIPGAAITHIHDFMRSLVDGKDVMVIIPAKAVTEEASETNPHLLDIAHASQDPRSTVFDTARNLTRIGKDAAAAEVVTMALSLNTYSLIRGYLQGVYTNMETMRRVLAAALAVPVADVKVLDNGGVFKVGAHVYTVNTGQLPNIQSFAVAETMLTCERGYDDTALLITANFGQTILLDTQITIVESEAVRIYRYNLSN